MAQMSIEKRDRAVAWCKQGISLDRLAIHLAVNTAPSLVFTMPSKQLTKCFEPQQNLRLGPLNRFKPPEYYYITDRSKTVLLMRFSVSLVLLSVSVLFSPSVCLGEF